MSAWTHDEHFGRLDAMFLGADSAEALDMALRAEQANDRRHMLMFLEWAASLEAQGR